MKVKKLIEELNKFDPEAQVIMRGVGYPVLFVLARTDDTKTVLVECETDCDVLLSDFFENAINEGRDELDVYSELLDLGITPTTVGKYLGEERGKYMHNFCEEHGLI